MPLLHINGVETHYHLQGRGRTIIFLHPPCMGSRVFTYLRNDLAQDHRVLAFDFRGHGRSASSKDRLSIAMLAEDVIRLMNELDIGQAYLCSYALASMVALQALDAYPDRVRGAALLSGAAELKERRPKLEAKLSQIASAFGAKGLVSFSRSWRHADNAEAFYRMRSEMRAGDPNKWKEYLDACLAFKGTERLPRIEKPVLLLYGENDKRFAPQARELQKGLPEVSTAWIPRADDRLPIHSADASAQIIRGWIAALEEGPRASARMREAEYPSETYGFDPSELNPAEDGADSAYKDYR
ncbi:alpha/beta fold hydrolase [Cohnella sp. AR92]|uniref:alpha/beta fold hydrolase n=1 Tax=Cohnella sp. AR92 TaxID=648716 RepID=UPI000F8C387C|nr:alpha/beta hydrolase [Cohnella sp. AR92]RUS45964.1 alpha/beta hydrolase [Cohnella sp. AR92]